MALGDVIKFRGGSYDVRGVVDGRFVVRIRDQNRKTEVYKVWTEEERKQFDETQNRMADLEDRNRQIYDMNLAGETFKDLSSEFGISVGRLRQICARQARKERRA